MPAKEATWTVERVELLKSRFEAGLSCRQIAADIGVSRNAVIGKLNRLNLTRDNNGDAPRPAPKGAVQGRRRGSVPRLQYRMLMALYAEPQEAADDKPIHSEHCCSLLELSEQKCRWPISTPGADDFCFCGNPPMEGLPYCRATPGSPTGRARASGPRGGEVGYPGGDTHERRIEQPSDRPDR